MVVYVCICVCVCVLAGSLMCLHCMSPASHHVPIVRNSRGQTSKLWGLGTSKANHHVPWWLARPIFATRRSEAPWIILDPLAPEWKWIWDLLGLPPHVRSQNQAARDIQKTWKIPFHIPSCPSYMPSPAWSNAANIFLLLRQSRWVDERPDCPEPTKFFWVIPRVSSNPLAAGVFVGVSRCRYQKHPAVFMTVEKAAQENHPPVEGPAATVPEVGKVWGEKVKWLQKSKDGHTICSSEFKKVYA